MPTLCKLFLAFGLLMAASSGFAADDHMQKPTVGDDVIEKQRATLARNTKNAGFGPQSPRDLTQTFGDNHVEFQTAPEYRKMHLCNIHLHYGAEHRGGEFTTYAGNGDGEGYGTGFLYDGELSQEDLAPVNYPIGKPGRVVLKPGDTIEQHYVYTTAQIQPGHTLAACFSDSVKNPQLRVETQVFVIVNNDNAEDLYVLNDVAFRGGYYQAPYLPDFTGRPLVYSGSTTGPDYNENGSPYQVTWSVRPKVLKVSARSVAMWLSDNMFDEDHVHAVRNLVLNPSLLSQISE